MPQPSSSTGLKQVLRAGGGGERLSGLADTPELHSGKMDTPLCPQWDSSSGTCFGAWTKQGGMEWHINVRGLGG